MAACRIHADLAIVSGILSIFNLLPLYPLDGGRALQGFLLSVLGEGRGHRIMERVTFAACAFLMVGACWLTVWMQMGIWPIFAALTVLWKAGTSKD